MHRRCGCDNYSGNIPASCELRNDTKMSLCLEAVKHMRSLSMPSGRPRAPAERPDTEMAFPVQVCPRPREEPGGAQGAGRGPQTDPWFRRHLRNTPLSASPTALRAPTARAWGLPGRCSWRLSRGVARWPRSPPPLQRKPRTNTPRTPAGWLPVGHSRAPNRTQSQGPQDSSALGDGDFRGKTEGFSGVGLNLLRAGQCLVCGRSLNTQSAAGQSEDT